MKNIFILLYLVVVSGIHPAYGQVVPRGGDVLQPDSNATIQWDTSTYIWGGDPSLSGGDVSIQLWNASAGTWSSVASSVACSAGSYTWSVPSDLSGSGFRMKIESLVDTNAFLISSSFFSIHSGSYLGKSVKQNKNGIVASLPDNTMFLTAAPNPFNQLTTVSFSIPVSDGNQLAEVRVLNILGQDVTTLVNDIKPAGQYSVTFDGSALPSGQYIVGIHTASHTESQLLVLAK